MSLPRWRNCSATRRIRWSDARLDVLFDLDEAQDGERTLMFHLSARSAFQELAVKAAIDGEDRWWSVSGRPIYDEFDNFVGFRGSGTDLTEKRRSQEERFAAGELRFR